MDLIGLDLGDLEQLVAAVVASGAAVDARAVDVAVALELLVPGGLVLGVGPPSPLGVGRLPLAREGAGPDLR